MPYLRPGLEVVVLFLAGLALGAMLQIAGLLPGNAAARFAGLVWQRPAPPPAAPARSVLQAEVTPVAPDPLLRFVPRSSSAPPQLVGDHDPDRNALRRAVIVSARRAVAAPCDLERRVAFQAALRDYARAWANAPRIVRERRTFRTPLDGEAVRSIGLAHRSGLIDPELVSRWRNLERTGLNEMLAQEQGSLADATPEPCPSARHAQARGSPTAL